MKNKTIIKGIVVALLLLLISISHTLTAQQDVIKENQNQGLAKACDYKINYPDYKNFDKTPNDMQMLSPDYEDTINQISFEHPTQKRHPIKGSTQRLLPTIIYVDDDNTQGPWDGSEEYPYQYIQDAVDVAIEEDIIFVFNGTYHEQILIETPNITLQGENKDTTIIDGDYETYYVVMLNATGVQINGFTIQHVSTEGWWWPALLIFSNDNVISDNIFTENNFGIDLYWYYYECRNNTIEENLFTDNRNGIGFFGGNNNTIKNNRMIDNVINGIYGYYSRHNTIINNTITGNLAGYGAYWGKSNYDTISGNTFKYNANGFRGDFLNSIVTGNTISNNWEMGMCIWDFANGIISENYISDNDCGIEFYGAIANGNVYNNISRNIIVNNKNVGIRVNIEQGWIYENIIVNNRKGIQIIKCDDNVVRDNTIIENDLGISLNYTNSGHIIYHNNLINNTQSAYDMCEGSFWDNGTIGNYWSDYTGEDQDENGIGDFPYDIPGGDNQDGYPLMETCGTLGAYIFGPYKHLIEEPLQFKSIAWGGKAPYTWEWDFGDGNTSTEQNPIHTYDISGVYEVTLLVRDSLEASAIATTTATIKIVIVDAKGPYFQWIKEPLQFSSSISGGSPPYSWEWDFDDGPNSTDENPVHTYWSQLYCGYNLITLTVTDSENNSDVDITVAEISRDEPFPPNITLIKPEKGFYINNRKILPLFFATIVIRSVDVEVEAYDYHTGVHAVEFIIDNNTKIVDKSEPFGFTWNQTNIFRHRHKIECRALDWAGNTATVEFVAWKFL